MKDPYTTLGVSRNASEDEIKKAYKDLVRKYHPDNYHDNPLADLASEKMKEVNEAYGAITKGAAGGASTGRGYGGYAGNTGYSGGSAEYNQIRVAINSGNIQLAEQLLSAIPNRNAEWNFLMGSVYYRKGWLDEARNYYTRATQLDPHNAEYRQAMDFMNMGGRAYQSAGYGQPVGIDACDICTGLLCMNMCCHC